MCEWKDCEEVCQVKLTDMCLCHSIHWISQFHELLVSDEKRLTLSSYLNNPPAHTISS